MFEDPSERHNLAAAQPAVYARLLRRLAELNATVFSPDRGEADGAACDQAVGPNGGYWGPFLP